MSTYNTITSLAESNVDENVLYAGTDDGIIQYTKDGGATWTKMDYEMHGYKLHAPTSSLHAMVAFWYNTRVTDGNARKLMEINGNR